MKSASVARRSGTSKVSLNHLYARRTVLNALIESFEDYSRYRSRRLNRSDEHKRKSA